MKALPPPGEVVVLQVAARAERALSRARALEPVITQPWEK